MLVSSAAAMALSLHPSPASDTSAFNKMRALVTICAGVLARANHGFEPIALLGAQLHHVLLDRNILLGHESPPSLLSRRQRFRKPPHFQGRGRLGASHHNDRIAPYRRAAGGNLLEFDRFRMDIREAGGATERVPLSGV